MFFGAPEYGAVFPFRFTRMTTLKLRRIVSNYYRAQGGIRPKPRTVATNPVPGIAFDVLVVALFVVLGLSYLL
jgi:hypothetical protein